MVRWADTCGPNDSVLNEDLLRRALNHAELPDGSVHYAAELPSTNTTALELASAGAPEWTLVATGRQTEGRGRIGRRWETPPSGGLTFSFVLRPDGPPAATSILSLLAGYALVSACGDQGFGAGVWCKWPNDVVLGALKVGGILTEARVTDDQIDHVAIGVGVNLGDAPQVEGAGALPPGDPVQFLSSFLAEFGGFYRLGTGKLAKRVLKRYRPLCATLGQRVRARTTAGDEVEGVAVDLDETGGLVVETDRGRATVRFGEVVHLRP
jgi:BirA family transcriptional regulator, biotin operon repressor / biotin---[acetyl-CoA-carboxylase] ligase